MNFFLLFIIFSLDFVWASSAEAYLIEPLTYFRDYYVNFPRNILDTEIHDLFVKIYCDVSNKILSRTFPPKLIKHFYNLNEKLLLPFIIFFWANILTIPLEAQVCHVDYLFGGNGFAWRKAVISLISYTKENLLIIKEQKKKRFLNLVVNFYHKKLRMKFMKSQKDRAKFDKIDGKFHQLAVRLETRMHEYEPPDNIHLALCYRYRDIHCQLNKLEHKVQFFYLIRYFRVTTSEYNLLNWLIKQPVKFIQCFLLFNICFTIDPDVPIKIPIIQSRLNTYYISLRRIVPIFELDFTTKKVEITMKKAEIWDRLPCLRDIDVDDLTLLLNQFFQKLSD
jgi:hypothetical protein